VRLISITFTIALLVQAYSAFCQDEIVYERAKKLDKLKNTHWRETIKDSKRKDWGYRSPFGLQIHPSCFKAAEKKGKTPDDVRKAFEPYFRTVFETVESCKRNYPEINQYLEEWVTHFRRTVLSCADIDHSKYGINLALASVLDIESYATEGLGQVHAFSSLPNELKSTVIVSKPWLDSVLNTRPTFISDEHDIAALIHEVLHSTHANNRWDHDWAQKRTAFASGACGDEDILTDRINLVTEICVSRSNQPVNPRRDLFKRIGSCGFNSCVRIFNEDLMESGSVIARIASHWAPARGLSNTDSRNLCIKLYNEGYCEKQVAILRENESYVRGAVKEDPRWTEVTNKVRARLYKFFPRDRFVITKKYLDSTPHSEEINQLITVLKDKPCFKKIFELLPNGNLKCLSCPKQSREAILGTLRWARLDIKKNLYSPVCLSDRRAFHALARLNDLMYRWVTEVENLSQSNSIWTLYQPFFFSGYEPLTPRLWLSILGPDLLQEFNDAIKKKYWKFDCKTAGFYPLHNSEELDRILKRKPVQHECKNCTQKVSDFDWLLK